MAKKLYTNSKIIVPDPYVIRIDHDLAIGMDLLAFRHFTKIARERVFGTYGYTQPNGETIAIKVENPAPPGSIAALFQNDTEYVIRSYWFFEDTVDATAFRLSIGEKAQHIYMWPSTLKFTVYDVSE